MYRAPTSFRPSRKVPSLRIPTATPRALELLPAEAQAAIDGGVIWIESTGQENTNYADEYGNRFYCKNYPA